ncbi:MAG: hypothetical protein HY585_03820 [Candidatus Omnitrophica bacterium]|nr:hypothetical protein [Candidatus Omnitrophota bacterium]
MNYDNMDGDIRKLLALLKKIVKNHPQGSEQLSKFMDQKSFDINLCFFSFIPMSPDDLLEFEEMYQDFWGRHEESGPLRREESKVEFKLDSDDLDFLSKNGIRF